MTNLEINYTLEEKLQIVKQRHEVVVSRISEIRRELRNNVSTYSYNSNEKQIEKFNDLCRKYVALIDDEVKYKTYIDETESYIEGYDSGDPIDYGYEYDENEF